MRKSAMACANVGKAAMSCANVENPQWPARIGRKKKGMNGAKQKKCEQKQKQKQRYKPDRK